MDPALCCDCSVLVLWGSDLAGKDTACPGVTLSSRLVFPWAASSLAVAAHQEEL